jgi:glycosyltransferase involved in cell wall biosynthesis
MTTIGISLDVLFPDFYPLLIEKGYEVVGICAEDSQDDLHIENVRRQGVRVITVSMTRGFTPFRDLISLWKLYKIFKKENFDLIHYSTPKAGLLGAIAGKLEGCSALLFSLRGLAYDSFSGIKREIGRFCDVIACKCAHYIIVIAPSLKKEALKEKLASAEKMHVLGKGSSKGVNLEKFRLNEETQVKAKGIRKELGIKPENIVIGYVGRLTEDKKLVGLLEAFRNIHSENSIVHMLWIGDQDRRNSLPDEVNRQTEEHPAIHLIPSQDKYKIANYMAAMDIFVLPSGSFREGFGNVVIEASAMEKPVIATNLAGSSSAVLDGITGILVKSHRAELLEKALKELIEDPQKRIKMGNAGRKWVEENFDRNEVWKRTIDVYDMLCS